jgi:hypothetical protein
MNLEMHTKFLIGKSQGKRPLRMPNHRCEDNTGMNFREINWEVVDWIYLAKDIDYWQPLMKKVMNTWIP